MKYAIVEFAREIYFTYIIDHEGVVGHLSPFILTLIAITITIELCGVFVVRAVRFLINKDGPLLLWKLLSGFLEP